MSEPIKVTIRRNIDRLTRVYIDDNSWEDDYSAVFQLSLIHISEPTRPY